METLGRAKPLNLAAMPLLRKGRGRPKRNPLPPIRRPGFFTKSATGIEERGIISALKPQPDRVLGRARSSTGVGWTRCGGFAG